MYTLLAILAVVFAVFMIGIVLIQESKGGGLASMYMDYKRLLGVRRSTSFVEWTTWILAGIIVLICVISSYVIN